MPMPESELVKVAAVEAKAPSVTSGPTPPVKEPTLESKQPEDKAAGGGATSVPLSAVIDKKPDVEIGKGPPQPRIITRDDRAWLDKAIRATLYGKTKLKKAEENHLLSLPRSEAVDELMTRPEFHDKVLDFNLYFLGSKIENIRDPLRQEIPKGGNYKTAMISAMELAHDGDYFALFNWKIPYFIGYSRDPIDLDDTIKDRAISESQRALYEQVEGLPDDKVQPLILNWMTKTIGEIQGRIKKEESLKAICYELAGREGSIFDSVSLLSLRWPFSELSGPSDLIGRTCSLDFDKIPSADLARHRAELIADLESTKNRIGNELPGILRQLPLAKVELKDFGRIPLQAFSGVDSQDFEAFGKVTWTNLPNASTNFDRRRSAYILKAFFCDDLTPINSVAVVPGASSRHASDANCAACHYKLDPMAGFFRYRGKDGRNFENQSKFTHDDGFVRADDAFQVYLDSWKSEDSSRDWNVGYIRSSSDKDLNDYGSSLDDLFAIIRRSKENKVCLTKKLAAYVLGDNQIYDGRWINEMAETLHAASKNTVEAGASSRAFKEVFKAMVLSNTFMTPDPVASQCYDFAKNSKPSTLPCEVAFVIEKNCATCHRGAGAPGGLDLTRWETDANGVSRFVHTDPATKKAIERAKTLDSIRSRISTSDLDLQMPPAMAMDSLERATLFKWIDTQIKGQ